MQTRERYEILADILNNHFGLNIQCFSPTVIRMLLAKLPQQIDGSDLQVIRRIVTACSIGETMFLRHPEQFAALAQLAPTLPRALAGEPIQAWSAGCASGEEAYSLAATLNDRHPYGVSVVGTDLNQGFIERAKSGHYTFWSMRGVDLERARPWLDGGQMGVTVLDPVRRLAEFRVMNLMTGPFLKDQDVIFCRNVLLYFCPKAAEQVLTMLAESLSPGGILVLGYTDPMPAEHMGLRGERKGNVVYYRRVENAAMRAAAPRPASITAVTPEHEPVQGRHYSDSISIARGLAAQREFADALTLLRELARKYPLETEANTLGALIAEEAGLNDDALEFARRACFLDPQGPLNQYLLGISLVRLGEPAFAFHRLALAGDAIREISDPSAALRFGCGLTGNQLRRMIDAVRRSINHN